MQGQIYRIDTMAESDTKGQQAHCVAAEENVLLTTWVFCFPVEFN